MDKTEQKPMVKAKRGISKKIAVPIIAAIVLLTISVGVLIYSKASGQTVKEMVQSFAPEKTEHTIVLSEFLVNLNSQVAPTNTVLRINIAIKYLDEKNSKLASWLMSRADSEYVLKIRPSIINSWDFSGRMEA